MSLKEDLREIVWSIDAKFDDNRPSCNSDYYVNAIINALVNKLPEKKNIGTEPLQEIREELGFNACLREVKQILEGK